LTKLAVCSDLSLDKDKIEWYDRLKEGNLSALFKEVKNTNDIDELLTDANLASFFNTQIGESQKKLPK